MDPNYDDGRGAYSECHAAVTVRLQIPSLLGMIEGRFRLCGGLELDCFIMHLAWFLNISVWCFVRLTVFIVRAEL